ncbi:hypothetical protein H2LOC_011440 [Methylocystis heyeri]|uniref:Transposase n=1 Tax=Methylocystis heyeri TaxID=391905 RepID=A0A6B8KH02_9HYPH|nr:hypothetical protein H2LOC_011440 [Methylocystis heyeri]
MWGNLSIWQLLQKIASRSLIRKSCVVRQLDHWSKIYSTTGLERPNGEVKRRTEVVGIFSKEDVVKGLVGAILLEQIDE